MQKERHRYRQSEKQAPHAGPNAGLNSRTLGSQPEPKADAQPLCHPGAPSLLFIFLKNIFFIYLFREKEREAETQAEGKAGSMQEPEVGLDPESPGSHPRLQAAPNRCATRAAPFPNF